MKKICKSYDYQFLYFDKSNISQLKDVLMLYNYEHKEGNMWLKIKSRGRLIYGHAEFGRYISEFNNKAPSSDEDSAFISIINDFNYSIDNGNKSYTHTFKIIVFNPV